MRLFSIITRDGAGPLRIVADRKPVAHTDDHGAIDTALAERVAAGDDMVLILADDDSVMRHWTRPPADAPAPVAAVETTKGRAARRHVAKSAAKRKAKR